MKKILSTIIILLLLAATAWAKPPVVGFVTGTSGLGDMSFNDMAYGGIRKAQQEFNFKLIILESRKTGETTLKDLTTLADQADVIILLGAQHQELTKQAARIYPDKKFIMIEVPIKNVANISSAVFKQYEGSFLAGALAGYVTKTHTIGFIGGAEVPAVQQFEKGFLDGAEYAAPGTKVLVEYLSPAGDFSGFNNPKKGYKLAMNQYGNNTDIIFTVAGLTGNGIIEAARRSGKYAIGVDSDQDSLAKGNVLTSMIKRMDIAAYEELKDIMKGKFSSGPTYYGLEGDGVSLSEMKYTRDKISDEILKKIDIIRKKIIKKEIIIKKDQYE
ncbi:BMP family protein [Maridesulfovibrio ferrireducens]|uniref:BMP family lipoprotein n=1 Tax=Maridesulfovibrio ferrireducens TaxID=246191 RepID=UPI001A293E25|nr:BMP family ABC transporter substrate-binding protein [Maridesulfovibrio ferrireducens]MBI9110710.1 BMP family ABC transporter substrate-binding protein [Maridesulfovibrio ferrireducens]